jgi:hypothetical protein
MIFVCMRIDAFGTPVVPDVKMMEASSHSSSSGRVWRENSLLFARSFEKGVIPSEVAPLS